ncbi:hypothetical protein [Prolixibacter sp. SD074]|jgi:hypothetical protein|uniref:hypothetical protein n=1 Tax=Prolixibacter sp. SD074 TaxID=2652391 RepID=UPI001270D19F|nr:hypothetical protein [Prolixibacter sp. SD074]GET29907.1 hypothetical protein SD074_21090 [Prolixibacter sp. SD074]
MEKIEQFKKHLQHEEFSFQQQANVLIVKSKAGKLKIDFQEEYYSIRKLKSINQYSSILGTIFFFVVAISERHQPKAIIYVLIVLFGVLHLIYSDIILEIRGNRIHSILERIYYHK